LRHRVCVTGGEAADAGVVVATSWALAAETSPLGAVTTEDVEPDVADVVLVVAWPLPAEPEQPATSRHAPMTRHGLLRVIHVSVVEIEETQVIPGHQTGCYRILHESRSSV
jgi:hypothetical protein